MKVNKEIKALTIFFFAIVVIALVLTSWVKSQMDKQAVSALSGKSCKVVEINLYSGLESVKCDDGVTYTYKK